ncbi:radical SAM superfamily enzyme YgiQ (UPF0313 family) [Geothermobacter ehrlichii]|uniref:Radical SAM superfamily enzyme YgiQ (UPF0313 family) n=1 Tax=Geothermobacter ehrlichii TaxID=213224 RepID=A0A5D3WH96_9BACT|nr:B12-binding domain-containing radical SAM protein [Geothermobacter ehrlichii]TYO96681.1 radical SAM superfamily enzyme YgiQ (UPF0313 family) [Geothermobacter ehrlichii]
MGIGSITFLTLHVRPSAQAVPLAAGCLAAALPPERQRDCRLLDFTLRDPIERIVAAVVDTDPDLLVLPVYVWNRRQLAAVVRNIRRNRPQLKILAGGPEASARPAALLAEGICDLVLRGEGETTFPELVDALDRDDGWQQMAGLCWLEAEGMRVNPFPATPLAPEQLPSPWLSGVLKPQPGGGVLWETARGCAFGCDFCFDAGGQRRVRPLPDERLEAELELFCEAGVGQVWILDSTFNHPPQRGKKLLQLLRDRAPGIHFHLEAKADFLDRETAALLAEIDCSVQVGLQSADPDVLRRVHRPFNPRVFVQAMNLLNSEQVTYGLDLIYGLPGDDFAGFCRSLDFALGFAPNHLDIFPLAILPGTDLASRAEREGIVWQQEPPYEIRATPQLPEEDLERCRELAAAVDLFYNTGRAVGLLPGLLQSLGVEAVDFFQDFTRWLKEEQGIFREALLDTESWTSPEVLAMQESYIQHLLMQRQRLDLLPAALDLLRYHFHHAETSLGPEVLPAESTPEPAEAWRRPWRLAAGARLIPFHYEIVDLLDMEGAELEEIAAMLRPVGSVALFIRRGSEVWCESLEEDFQRLLKGSDGIHSPETIFAGGIETEQGQEMLAFALAEGLLVSTS